MQNSMQPSKGGWGDKDRRQQPEHISLRHNDKVTKGLSRALNPLNKVKVWIFRISSSSSKTVNKRSRCLRKTVLNMMSEIRKTRAVKTPDLVWSDGGCLGQMENNQ